MKKIVLGSFASLLLLSGCKVGFFAGSFNGAVTLSDKTFSQLNVNGAADLNRITVEQDARINGAVDANTLRVGGSLHINGAPRLQHADVRGKTIINGALEASESTFGDMTINAHKAVLRTSETGSLLIRKPSDSKPQIIELDGTTVAGDITFEKEGGKVIVRNGSKIEGKIIGGEQA